MGGGVAQITYGPIVRPRIDQAILSKERVESYLYNSPLSARHLERRDGTWNGDNERRGQT